MSRRRTTKFLAVLASASFIAAACSSDDGESDEISEGTGAAGAPTTGSATETTGDAGSATTEPEGTEPEGTEPEETDPEGTDPEGTEPEGSVPPGAEDVGVEGGSGCGIPHGPYEDPGEAAGEVRVAWNDPLLSFNTQSSRGNATANNNPLYLMGLGNGGGFTYYDQDLNLINNDQFGTCTLESLEPLSVTYQINEGVNWSDDVPIDAADLMLTWAATSTVFNDAESVVTQDGTTAVADAEGNPVVLGPDGAEVPFPDVELTEDGALPEGFTYQESAGIQFDAVSESLQLVTEVPEVSDDGRGLTATWDGFYVDYQTAGIGVGLPAHTVARLAGLGDDPAAGKQALLDAFANNDTAAIKAISEVWNRGFDATSLPSDPGIYLSAGAYELTAYDELSQMVFEANPDYTWGPRPNVQTIVYRIIGEPTAAVQALANEEIDIIQPQSTADLLAQVEGLADRGIEVDTGDTGTYEHVDLIFNNGGPFDPATYDGDEATALAVRQAFLKAIPRQGIIDRLIVPLNPDGQLRDSFTTVVGAPTYEAIVSENGSAEYAEQDIEGGQALLEEAEVTTPVDVRFLFADNNPRRSNEYDLISAAAAEIGFNLIDGRSPTWGQDLSDSSLYDASLFGWQSTAVAVADTEANFVTDGQNNYGGYSSEEVDGFYEELTGTTDADAQQELLVQIESQLYEDAFGVPIFQHPGLTAWNSNYVTNVSDIPLAPTVFWNFWEWEAA